MNVVVLRSNPVNPDSRVEKEVKSLKDNGYNVEILAWDREKDYKLEKKKLYLGEHIIDIYRKGIKASFGGGGKNLIPLIKFQINILNFLIRNRNRVDVIHACDFDTALAAFLFCKIFRKKIVYDIFDYYVDAFNVPSKMKPIIRWMDKQIMQCSDAIIITNEARKEQIGDAKPKRLYIIHNTPYELESYDKTPYILHENTKLKIVYVGILSKGRFLEEICNVTKDMQGVELYIGGFGELEEKIKSIAERNKNINFLGKLTYKEVLELEKEADVLMAIYDPEIPNHKYSSPNKLYEALMLGKPIIVAKNTGIDKLVEKEGIGWSIEYTEKELDELLKKIINCNLPSVYETNNKELYKNYYSWSKMQEELLKIYREI